MIDYKAEIYRVLGDEALLDRARERHAKIAADVLSRNHERDGMTLRASDAGRCVLELWSELHGERDIPEEPNSLLRMQTGSLTGAWLASLLTVGVESQYANLQVDVEIEFAGDIPGHCDALVSERVGGVAVETVECKMTMGVSPPDHPLETKRFRREYHVWQSGFYARAASAPTHCVLSFAPALQKRAVDGVRLQPDMVNFWRFETAQTNLPVTMEYQRLSAALEDFPPDGDAVDAFRCESCRYSGCSRNENPLRPQEIEA